MMLQFRQLLAQLRVAPQHDNLLPLKFNPLRGGYPASSDHPRTGSIEELLSQRQDTESHGREPDVV